MNDILILGPRCWPDKVGSIGGATVLFEQMIHDFGISPGDPAWTTIATNKFSSRHLSLFYVVVKSVPRMLGAKLLFLNANQAGVIILWPLMILLGLLTNTKISLRCFGADFDRTISYLGIFGSFCLEHTHSLYVETKQLKSSFSNKKPNVYWLPNSRPPISPHLTKTKNFTHKFLYLGKVAKAKGIQELISAFDKAPSTLQLKIYGPLERDLLHLQDSKYYFGVLAPDQIVAELKENDVLVLPTYYEGEGYPGVIIEAYRQGLPVIATNWGGIPEILIHNKHGFVISPKSPEAILQAIEQMTSERFQTFSKHCLKEFELYNSEVNHKRLFEQLKQSCAA